jgi:hypothetical protein
MKTTTTLSPAPYLTHRQIFWMKVDGKLVGDTMLASYWFDYTDPISGHVRQTGCNGIHAIAMINTGRSSARHMVRSLLKGKLPKGIIAHNPTTTEWLDERRERFS